MKNILYGNCIPENYLITHIFRIMKLQFLFLFIFCLGVCAENIYSQDMKVNIISENVSLKDVIKEIEEKTDYLFLYNKDEIDLNRKTSVKASNTKVADLLTDLFRGTNIKYTLVGNNIVLMKNNQTSFQQAERLVTGVVTDEYGEPIIGANVMLKGTTNGVITNIDGEFSITVPDDAVLQISYIGYINQEVVLKNQTSLQIILKEDLQTLEEIVVVGYGTQKKVNLTGAITTVKMDDVLGDRPVGNTLQALEGAVPGLQITRNNGKPGASMNMNVRGVTSINDNNNGQPLVLVDNVPMDIDLLDPNDIESVTTLKDAAASAIYGARAAFGVILITTKQGKKDTPVRVTYNTNLSFSTPSELPEKVNPLRTVQTYIDQQISRYYGGQDTEKWLGYIQEYNQGKYPEGFLYDDGVRYNLAPTDYYKDMMSTAGFQQQHSLAVSGGSAKTSYRISFGMIDQDGILVTDKDSYKRYNASAFVNLDATEWLSFQADVRYSDSKTSTAMGSTSEHGDAAIWSFAADMPTMAPLGYGYATEDDPELLPFGTPANFIRLSTPKINRSNNTRLLGRAILKPLKDLEIIGEYSFNRFWWSERQFNELFTYIAPVTGEKKPSNTVSTYSMGQRFETTNAINVFATYSKDIEDHSFSVMGGFNQESWYYELLESTRQDPINQNLPSLSQSTGTITTKDAFQEYALRSLFYRVNYAYKGKYLIEANGRYDGSSRFPKDDRFGFFPSFSGAWRISEEGFMEHTKSWLDNLKLRASWGSIGNQNVGYYDYIPIMDAVNDLKWILPGEDKYVTTLGVPGLVSSSFTWETVNTLDIGIDLNLFNRLGIVFDWYQRDTKDMLTAAKPLPIVLGTDAPKVNAANLRSKGWELAINWNDKIGEDIRYNIGFNLYDATTTITKYSNESGLLTYTKDDKENIYFREGMKFGEIWGYTTDRFYTDADFENGTLKEGIPSFQGMNRDNINPGDILYVDFDGDGIISPGDNTESNPGDMKVIGNSTPRYQYGINGGVGYKNFDLSFFFNGIGKRDIWLNSMWAPAGQFQAAVFDYQTDYWRENNQHTYYPRIYGEGGNNAYNNKRQTKYLQDGSYLRLKNVTLGYNLPKHICERLYIQKLRVFVSGENLFTWHDLPKGYNPDSYNANPGRTIINAEISGDSGSGAWSYPLMRQYSFGINLTF